MGNLLPPHLWNVVLAMIVCLIGLAALLLFFLRWKHKNVPVAMFGITSFLYGSRLFAEIAARRGGDAPTPEYLPYLIALISYVIPVPLSGFLLHLFGAGWRGSMRWLVRGTILFACCGILSDVLWTIPFSLMRLNNVLVVIWAVVFTANIFHARHHMTRELWVTMLGFLVFGLLAVNENLVQLALLPWKWKGEALGFMVFLLALGFVTTQRFFANESRLLAMERELEIARRIQSSILPQHLPAVPGLDMAVRYVPMVSVAGDFYDALVQDEKRVCLLMADVSGHGIGAALIASMLKVAFAAQAPWLSDPARVLFGLNQVLLNKLGTNFVTASCLFVDAGAGKLRYAGAGHPPLLLYRRSERFMHEVCENGLMLGLFPQASYKSVEMNLERGDRMLLYTDGIIETKNDADVFFGDDRFRNFIQTHDDLSPNRFADELLLDLLAWSGRPRGETLDDDVTLLICDKT